MNLQKNMAAIVLVVLMGAHRTARADGWTESDIKPPSEEARIATDVRGFAQGRYTVILAKGGPTGYWVWAHLHGKHSGLTGSTKYKRITPMVLGQFGYPYFVGKSTSLTIGANPSKPSVSKHKWFTQQLSGDNLEDVKAAIAAKVKMKSYAAGERSRGTISDDIGKQIEKAGRDALQDFLDGDTNRKELIKKLKAASKGPNKG